MVKFERKKLKEEILRILETQNTTSYSKITEMIMDKIDDFVIDILTTKIKEEK